MNYRDIDRYIKESLSATAGNDDIKPRLIAAFDGLQKSIEKSGNSSVMDKSALVEKLCTGLLDIVDLLNSNRRQEAHNKLFDLYFKDNHRERLQLCTDNVIAADALFVAGCRRLFCYSTNYFHKNIVHDVLLNKLKVLNKSLAI